MTLLYIKMEQLGTLVHDFVTNFKIDSELLQIVTAADQ